MLLKIEDLVKNYGNSRGVQIDYLEIEGGHIIGLLGPNGSGKTTLIKILNGLLTPNKGKVLVDGNPVGIESKKVISYLPERTYLNMDTTVKGCLDYFNDFYEDFDLAKAKMMLNTLNVPLNAKLKTLSKGTKEKVQLVLVMSRNAKLFILDEPIAGVDPGARDVILKMIIDNMSKDASLIICTHLVRDIEPLLDDVIFLTDGKVYCHKSADEIRQEHGGIVELFKEIYVCF